LAAMADSDDALDDVSMDSDDASMHTSDEDFDESIPLNEDGRLRMRADINMEGPEYSGRKSSRLAAFESKGEELPVSQSLMGANGKGFNFEYEDEDDDDLLLGGRAGNEEDDQLEALNEEYEELCKQEEELVNRLKGKKSEDQGKGDAVRHQKVLWDRALEIRIAIQKLVTGVHCFPVMQGKDASLESDNECEKARRMVTEAAATALNSFLELKQVLVEQNEAVVGSDSAGVDDVLRKRKGDFEDSVTEDENSESLCDTLWERMTSLYSRITPFRNSSVDRWQRKTQLATGAGALKGKLQAFNQSISQQLTTVMRDPSQLIENIRLRQAANQVFCQSTYMLLIMLVVNMRNIFLCLKCSIS